MPLNRTGDHQRIDGLREFYGVVVGRDVVAQLGRHRRSRVTGARVVTTGNAGDPCTGLFEPTRQEWTEALPRPTSTKDAYRRNGRVVVRFEVHCLPNFTACLIALPASLALTNSQNFLKNRVTLAPFSALGTAL
ncbi:MAG: hypothetical protein ACI85K_002277 [Hyphomicrobiaceae bacterium]|jgi:hypothetical protein